MTRVRIFMSCVIWVMTASAVHADTDYRCLSSCINEGGNGPSCMKSCTYSPNQVFAPDTSSKPNTLKQQDVIRQLDAAKQTAALKPQGHKQFAPQILDTGQLLLPATSKPNRAANEDYSCLYPCLQNGSQYNFCRDKCAVKTSVTDRQSEHSPKENR